MAKTMRSLFFYVASFIACGLMALTTGCASGGYKLTRTYARWVNKQNVILRIIIYLLTSIVFAVTFLIDSVVFNTMDFWQGTVSGGNFDFQDGDRNYHASHEVMPGTQLKRSTITVTDKDKKLLQTVVLKETLTGEIELYVDGNLRTKVRDIASLPIATYYDASGKMLDEKALFFTSPDLKTQKVASR